MLIARIPDHIADWVLALCPHFRCPYCGALYLGPPSAYAPEFTCACGVGNHRVGIDPQTGAVWQLEEAEFSEWEEGATDRIML